MLFEFYTEDMTSNNFSNIKMVQNWRTEPNWRSSGAQAPRYFIRRNNWNKNMNFESPTITLLNKMMSYPSFNISQVDIKKFPIMTGRVDFYPVFEGISNVENSLGKSCNIIDFDKSGIYSTKTGLNPYLIENKNSENYLNRTMFKEEFNKNIEVKTMVENNKDQVQENVVKEELSKEVEDILENNNKDITNFETSKVMTDRDMLQQTKHGPDISKNHCRNQIQNKKKSKPNKSKKNKKSKSGKHKTKSRTMLDILESRYDACDYLEDPHMDERSEKSKLSCDNLTAANRGCSSRLSQSFEKCWNYLQKLPPVKHINTVLAKGPPNTNRDTTNKQQNFVYVHNLNEGLVAAENLSSDFDKTKCRRRIPSECDTEDSFVIFFEDDQNDAKDVPDRSYTRQPSICESNDSFVICFGEASQSPQDCFMFDDIIDNSEDGDETSSSLSDSESESEDCSFSSDSLVSKNNSVQIKSASDDLINSGKSQRGCKKKVTFNPTPEIHHLIAWSFAYQEARKGVWEQIGRDRSRFQARIDNMKNIIDPILDLKHRDRIYSERFAKMEEQS